MNNNILKVIIVFLVVVILGLGLWQFVLKPKSSSEIVIDEPTPTTSAGQETGNPPSFSTYKDGTYSAAGQYQNPVSKEDVNITITLKDGIITAATFTGTPDNPTTVTMQNRFKSGFSELVVGKPIDEVALTVVNGSSLTPKGFMDALSKVKEQAKG